LLAPRLRETTRRRGDEEEFGVCLALPRLSGGAGWLVSRSLQSKPTHKSWSRTRRRGRIPGASIPCFFPRYPRGSLPWSQQAWRIEARVRGRGGAWIWKPRAARRRRTGRLVRGCVDWFLGFGGTLSSPDCSSIFLTACRVHPSPAAAGDTAASVPEPRGGVRRRGHVAALRLQERLRGRRHPALGGQRGDLRRALIRLLDAHPHHPPQVCGHCAPCRRRRGGRHLRALLPHLSPRPRRPPARRRCKENGPRAIWLIEFWCLMNNIIRELISFLVFVFVVHRMRRELDQGNEDATPQKKT
jgi:hypothetical protein